jgi:hypothetical protein
MSESQEESGANSLGSRSPSPPAFRMLAYPVVPAAYLVGTGLLTAAVVYERPVVRRTHC